MAKTPTLSSSVLRVALVGNPNTGKTTLFNRLTGARQKIANYPGVTVEKKSGTWECGGRRVELVDLPGTYRLAASSPDERVSFDFLTGHLAGEPAPDAVICVVDASNLVRNLFLASQIADLGLPLVIALNMSDAAEKAGIRVDAQLLSRHLGVPVVRTVATKGEGIDALEKAVNRAIDERACMAQVPWPEAVGRAVSYLRDGLEKEGVRPLADGELRRVVFDRQSAVLERAGIPPGFDPAPLLSASRDILTAAGIQPLPLKKLQDLLRGRFLFPQAIGNIGYDRMEGFIRDLF